VKVLLSGEGSDEIFAGYPKYKYAQVAAWADSLPPVLRKHLFKRLERLLPEKYNKLRVMLRAMSAPNEAERFQTWFAPFTSYERDILLPGKTRNDYIYIWKKAEGDLIRRMLYFDCHTWLVDNLLERGDKMAMAASVEYRPPFLDHNLVELAFKLPSSMKVHKGTTKWILKEVARKYLPSLIVDRKKVGFRVPLDLWFRGKLKEVAYDLLLSSNSFISHNMNRQYIRDMLKRHEKGRSNEEIRIWTLLCLEIWHQVFIKNITSSFLKS
jgi:asparagine synthase (glutamine-hydrolysing)